MQHKEIDGLAAVVTFVGESCGVCSNFLILVDIPVCSGAKGHAGRQCAGCIFLLSFLTLVHFGTSSDG